MSEDESDDYYPQAGDWIDCWNGCDEGWIEGDDPLWDLGEWRRCDVCGGKGGWICTPASSADKEATNA